MTNFEKVTASPEALGAFLASFSVAGGPWDAAFHRAFCDGCQAENCDAENCPHNVERGNQTWWLNQADQQEEKPETTPEERERHMAWLSIVLSAISIAISSTAIVLAIMKLVL